MKTGTAENTLIVALPLPLETTATLLDAIASRWPHASIIAKHPQSTNGTEQRIVIQLGEPDNQEQHYRQIIQTLVNAAQNTGIDKHEDVADIIQQWEELR